MTDRLDELGHRLTAELQRTATQAAWPEPTALRRRGERRRAVRHASIALTAVVVLAGGAAAGATLTKGGGGHPAPVGGSGRTSIGPSGPTSAPSTPSPSTSEASPKPPTDLQPLPGARETFGPISLTIPSGWKVTRAKGSTYGDPTNASGPWHSACIASPALSADPGPFGCRGIQIWYDGFLPGAEGRPFAPHTLNAYWHGTDMPGCPVGGPALAVQQLGGDPDVADLQQLGSKRAYHDSWHAVCAGGYDFHPQAWYLPVSKVLVFDYEGNEQADAILTTLQPT